MPELESAWAQLYYAQIVGSEAAWRKAVDYPGDDEFIQQIAQRGLVRCYLVVTENYRAALSELRKLQRLSEGDATNELLQAFSLAGLCITEQNLGNEDAARDALAKLNASITMRDLLRSEEPQIFQLLQTTLQQLDGANSLERRD